MTSAYLDQVTHDADQTRALGRRLGQCLRAGDLVTLAGPLGAGKTTFVQGIAMALGLAEGATSPTFVLINEYPTQPPLVHLDAYRLHGNCYDELRDAGALDMFDRSDAIKLVEWPERVTDFLPAARFAVTLEPGAGADDRRITIIEQGQPA